MNVRPVEAALLMWAGIARLKVVLRNPAKAPKNTYPVCVHST
jgi:hypothetical protein